MQHEREKDDRHRERNLFRKEFQNEPSIPARYQKSFMDRHDLVFEIAIATKHIQETRV